MHFLSEKSTGKEIPECSKMKEDMFFEDSNGGMELAWTPIMINRAKHTVIHHHNFISHVGEILLIIEGQIKQSNNLTQLRKYCIAYLFYSLRKKVISWWVIIVLKMSSHRAPPIQGHMC